MTALKSSESRIAGASLYHCRSVRLSAFSRTVTGPAEAGHYVRYSRDTDSFTSLAATFLTSNGAPSLPADTDVPEFVASAARDGLLGLMHAKILSGCDHRLPRALTEAVRAGACRQAALELAHRAELQRVVAAMHARGVAALLMKGASLAYNVYPDPAWRVRSDTDIFIRDAQRDQARACLEDLGYTSEPEVAGTLVAYQFHTQRIDAHGIRHLCDVHWKIANPQRFANAIGFDELAAGAVPLPLVGASARGIGRVHALWLACVHRAAHHYDRDALVWLYDVHLLATALDAGGMTRFAALAERTGVRRICLRALLLARERFGTAITRETLTALEAAPADEPSTMFLRADTRMLDVLLDDVRVLPGWAPRLTLLKEHLFPDAAYMRRTYARGSSAPTMWLYLRRIAGGASKWIRR
jgi:hypothetical protein